MASRLIPVVKADDDDIIDPQVVLREKCSDKPEAKKQYAKFQECQDRVNSRSNTAETCAEEIIDYFQIVDKCVSKDLWNHLK